MGRAGGGSEGAALIHGIPPGMLLTGTAAVGAGVGPDVGTGASVGMGATTFRRPRATAWDDDVGNGEVGPGGVVAVVATSVAPPPLSPSSSELDDSRSMGSYAAGTGVCEREKAAPTSGGGRTDIRPARSTALVTSAAIISLLRLSDSLRMRMFDPDSLPYAVDSIRDAVR